MFKEKPENWRKKEEKKTNLAHKLNLMNFNGTIVSMFFSFLQLVRNIYTPLFISVYACAYCNNMLLCPNMEFPLKKKKRKKNLTLEVPAFTHSKWKSSSQWWTQNKKCIKNGRSSIWQTVPLCNGTPKFS